MRVCVRCVVALRCVACVDGASSPSRSPGMLSPRPRHVPRSWAAHMGGVSGQARALFLILLRARGLLPSPIPLHRRSTTTIGLSNKRHHRSTTWTCRRWSTQPPCRGAWGGRCRRTAWTRCCRRCPRRCWGKGKVGRSHKGHGDGDGTVDPVVRSRGAVVQHNTACTLLYDQPKSVEYSKSTSLTYLNPV